MTRIVTQEGLEKLKAELEERTTITRQNIANSIKEAKEQGDLSENAEYSAAKGEQVENEQKIAELENLLKEVKVVQRNQNDSSIQIGDTVTVKAQGKELNFEIVGSNEADPAKYKISNESPIGSALIGSSVGDKVDVDTPSGVVVTYEIISIN